MREEGIERGRESGKAERWRVGSVSRQQSLICYRIAILLSVKLMSVINLEGDSSADMGSGGGCL